MAMIDSDVLLSLFRLQKQENITNGYPYYAGTAINQCIAIVNKVVDGDYSTMCGTPITQKGDDVDDTKKCYCDV
jgi:hypothetical protein